MHRKPISLDLCVVLLSLFFILVAISRKIADQIIAQQESAGKIRIVSSERPPQQAFQPNLPGKLFLNPHRIEFPVARQEWPNHSRR